MDMVWDSVSIIKLKTLNYALIITYSLFLLQIQTHVKHSEIKIINIGGIKNNNDVLFVLVSVEFNSDEFPIDGSISNPIRNKIDTSDIISLQ